MSRSSNSNSFNGSYYTYKSRRHMPEASRRLPLPKGDSSYARGKRAEYIEKDLELAKAYYMQAIEEDERSESAVKDITSILHQQHRTKEACEFLEKYKSIFTDPVKYNNLYTTLSRQINGTGNSLNSMLRLSPISEETTAQYIRQLFSKPNRIQEITLGDNAAFITFPSHSAARKTLESFSRWDTLKVEWVSVTGQVQGQARQGQTMLKPSGNAPEDDIELPSLCRDPSENTAVLLLGKSLYEEIYINN